MPNISVSIESLEGLLSTYVAAHETLSSTSSNMSNALSSVEWQSPAAEVFRNAWNEEYHPNLVKLLDAVDHFNAEIRAQIGRYKANEGLGG